ncbi:MAG TPA: hemolysin family protein, partial [Blastocatellia bacterium]|nr:hemolysin family protein [Blastocatellia bacterium]
GYIDNIPALAAYSKAIGVGLVVLAITYLSLILGELVPKRLALSNSEKIASAMARPMRLLSVIASPAVRLLSFSTDAVLKVLGVKPSAEPPVTEEEIKILIRQGTEAGVFEEAEKDIVENVFRLGDQHVRSLMTPRTQINYFDVKDSPEEIQRKLAENSHSRFPVCDGNLDRVLGIVRAKDILAQLLGGNPVDLRAVLRQAVFAPESMRAMTALEYFKQSGVHLLLVIDEYGGTEGLITHHDVLEAIVGDIALTREPDEHQAVQREDGSWLLDGMTPLDEMKEILHIKKLPGEDWESYHTLAGFVLMKMGRIPKIGERFEWGGMRFEVMDLDGRRVDKVLVTPVGKAAPGYQIDSTEL